MAFEAFANVLSNIGRDYAARKNDDRLHERARSEKLADVADARAYEDTVRQKQFDNALALAQKSADIELKKQIDFIKQAEPAQVLAKAEAMGVATTNIDGTPRDVAQVRADMISRTQAEAAQAVLAQARATAAAGADPEVLANRTRAQAGEVKGALEAQIENAPLAIQANDAANTQSKEVFQSQLDNVSAQLKVQLDRINGDPALSAAANTVDDIKKQVAAALAQHGTGAQQMEYLRKNGITEDVMRSAYSGDAQSLAMMARVAGVTIDTKSASLVAAAQANAQAYSAVQIAQQLFAERNAIMRDARNKGIELSFGADPVAAPAPAPATPAAPTGLQLPSRGTPTAAGAPIAGSGPSGIVDFFKSANSIPTRVFPGLQNPTGPELKPGMPMSDAYRQSRGNGMNSWFSGSP